MPNKSYRKMGDAFIRFVATPATDLSMYKLADGEVWREIDPKDYIVLKPLFNAFYKTEITLDDGCILEFDGMLGSTAHLKIGKKEYVGFPKDWETEGLHRCGSVLKAMLEMEVVK